MASNFEGSMHRGSDLFFDFSCYTCQGNDRNTEAEFYCQECSKFYCCKCMEYHNYLFKQHETLGKENNNKWPISTVDALEKCQEHKKENLTIFCEDHSELICHVCHVYNHQKCSHVVLIADKVKDLHQKGEFNNLSATVKTLRGHLIQKKDDFEESMQLLEKSYQMILEEIHALRKAINDALDKLERNTIKELDTLLAKLRTSIQTDIKNCTESTKKMTCLQDDWLNVKDKREAINFIMYRTCLDQSLKTREVLKQMTAKKHITVTLNPDKTIQKHLSTLSGLGKILGKVNTETRQNKPKCYDILPSKFDQGNQTSASNKSGMVSNPVLGPSRQAEIGNQTINENKSRLVSNPVSVTPRQADNANQTNAENKPGLLPNPMSSSSSQSSTGNITGNKNRPGLLPNPISITSTQSSTGNVTGYQNKSGLVSNSSHHLAHGNPPSAISKSDPNQVLKIKSSKKNTVRVKNDSDECTITGICETDTGEIIIIDKNNNKLKLLDQTYKVVAQWEFNCIPLTMCSIDSSKVAFALLSNQNVHFIRLTNGQVVQDRTLNPQHSCKGIAHHQGNLYVTSGTALYQYTVDGTLLGRLYENTLGLGTVSSCAVSPDGDRIYMTCETMKQLVTLSRDGTVISTLYHPDHCWRNLQVPLSIHVTDSGQVLLYGGLSNTIFQIERDGRQMLAKVVIKKDGVNQPTSVYYSKYTGALIVGMKDNDDIVVFKTVTQ